MPVHVVADTPTRLAAIRAMLEPKLAVTAELLGGVRVQRGEVEALVVSADLRRIEKIGAIKRVVNSLPHVHKRIFLVDETAHLHVSQAYALGATRVLVGHGNQSRLTLELLEQLASDSSSATVEGAQAAASVGEAALASMFTAVATGMPVDVRSTKNAGQHIADSIAEDGLTKWLMTVRRHHEGTYQHCLLVAGVAIDFGLRLGVRKADIERLYSAAIFHDVGKATIPIDVLDKPGRLDDRERALIETHPVAGYDALKSNGQISAEVLDAVRHHHEYLDGSGYPDGLCAESITDLVRILTISDIFAALIEHRRYKQPMSRADAYDALTNMRGKLEMPLVAAFEDVALTR